MAIPTIYRGDDTDFRGESEFTLRIKSAANLTGCTVEVELLGYRKAFPASATGELVCPFVFTAKETAAMPLGIHVATVRVYDAKGRVRTINNSIRVKVTNVISEAYGEDDPNEVTLKISALDLEGYARKKDIPDVSDFAKKKDVESAIADAMKSVSASTQLHALTPEVTDTTVTLKPVDGAANWVNRTVMVSGGVEKNLSFDLSASIDYYPITPEDELPSNMPHGIFIEPRAVLSTDNAVVEDVAQIDYEYYEISIKILKPVEIQYNENQYVNDPKSIGFPSHAAAGTDIYCHTGDLTFDCESDIKDCSFTASSVDSVWGLWDGFPDRITYNGEEYLQEGSFDSSRNLTQTIVKHYKDLHIALPDSTDHARSFSLALTTDATAETAVTWEGADEIIEAFPGSSKLIPGEIIWDVKEVAPGKFRVDRASSPAQSAPLTLTAPNGRVAELTVGDDLVLEVKEK